MSRRPNILLITADQWRGDSLGIAGHPHVLTPHTDALAAHGTAFLRHHATCAPCSPARASLYTGLFQANHRVVWNGAGLDARFDTLALAARRAGYRPTLFGYTDTAPDPRVLAPDDPALQTYEGVLPGFEVRQALPESDAPWLSWLAARGRQVDPETVHTAPPQPGEHISLEPPAYDADETQTAFLTGEFLHWLGEQGDDTPWFAHISFLRPHPPFVVPAPYNRMYDVDDLPDPVCAATPEAEAAQHPMVAAMQGYQKVADFIPGAAGLAREMSTRDALRLRAIYYGMITEVDAQIGRLMAGLKASGSDENTLVILTSDHAEMLGDHHMLGKGGFFEQSYHIPLIIRPPGGGAGNRVSAFTSAADIFPTLCDLMNVTPDHAPDGASLRAFLEGGAPDTWRDAALWEFDFRLLLGEAGAAALGLAPEDCVLACRRDDTHLYVHSPALPPALYDLRTDPGCRQNIATDPAAQADRLRMAEALLATRAKLADRTLACRAVWDHAAARKRLAARP